jgi:RimJ/RimL family protein N-acetyltransferase
MNARNLVLRSATIEDADLLLSWVNAPDVLWTKAETTQPIERHSHVSWLEKNLADVDTMIRVVERGGEPIGQVRLWRRGEAVWIDISIVSEARGKGSASEALSLALDEWTSSRGAFGFCAMIKSDNRPSLKLFERAGFHKDGETNGLAVYRRYGVAL